MAQVFDTPEKISAYRAIVIKGALKLLTLGMSPGRGWTKRATMDAATTFTGVAYKRTDCQKALDDMTKYVAELKEKRDE